MTLHNEDNERIKRLYFSYLKEAKRNSEATLDKASKALTRFEEHTRHKDFKTFRIKQAISFKKRLAEQIAIHSGEKLSMSTLNSTLKPLKCFFQWLAWQPGYKSRLQCSDAEYFNLSEKDSRIAVARREQKSPTLKQIKHVIASMSASTDIERRNRALVAFTLLTGARDSAIASMKLKHIDLMANCVHQDAREVKTKFSKTFDTFFFQVGDDIHGIVTEWVRYLRDEKLWGNDDPLFPATLVEHGASRQFEVVGLDRKCWSNATPIRKIFREAFAKAGLPYFNPHSFRHTLVRLGQERCRTPEEFKSWSQNLGHENVMTTLTSYGEVVRHRQGELIRGLTEEQEVGQSNVSALAKALAMEMQVLAK